MTRRGKRIVTAMIVIVISAGAIGYYWQSKVARVEVVSATTGPIVETLAIIGRVRPPAQVRFLAREPTAITRVPVQEGAHVEAGQLLVHMDDAEALSIVAQAEAALAQTRAQTRQMETLTSKTARVSLSEARAQLAEAERVAGRDEQLFESGALNAAALDRTRTARSVARSRVRAASLAAAASAKDGAQWQAAVAAETFAEAGLVAAKQRAERLMIRAPAPGLITARNVEVGDVVSPGSPLLTMVLDGETELVIEPDERNLAKLAVDQPAIASAEAFPERRFDARISYIAPAVDATRGTIEVRLAVPSPPNYLRTDMTVSVDVEVGRAESVLLIPSASVLDLSGDPRVLVVEGDHVVARPIGLGLIGADVVEVTTGLRPGEQFIEQPSAELEPGARVRVIATR